MEFKRANDRLPSSFFETVCAFLNMDGGLLVLGVGDDGTVSGIDPDAVERIKRDIANLSNNPQKIDPPYLLFPQDEEINGKWVIKVNVPVSSQVHATAGAVFLRSEDGDYRVRGVNRLAGLLNRKLGIFTEQRVYPYLGMADLDPALFEKAKRLMLARMPKHPWADLPHYAPGAGKPVFEDGDMFSVTVPLAGAGAPQVTPEVAPEVTSEVTPEVTPEVTRMLEVMTGEMTRGEIQKALDLRDEKHFREHYQQVAVKLGLIAMTIPDKPRSRLQKYRLTEKGRTMLKKIEGGAS